MLNNIINPKNPINRTIIEFIVYAENESKSKTSRSFFYLQKKGKQQLDSIALECSLPVFRTSSTLLNMEMKRKKLKVLN